MESLSYEDKVQLIRERYKGSKDLHTYMVTKRKYFFTLSNLILSHLVDYFLPDYKKCNSSYIVEVFKGKTKKHLKTTELCGKRPPDYNELKVKNCYHEIT